MGKASRNKRNRKDAAEGVGTLWHGGRAGLGVGEVLVPRDKLPPHLAAFPNDWSMAARHTYGTNKVFVTTDYDLAESFAAAVGFGDGMRDPGHGFGAVYRVEVRTPLEHDDDFKEGVSFGTRAAVIAEVVDPQVPGSLKPPKPAALKHQTWDEGSPMYDADGYGLPPLAAQHFDVTAADLRHLGYAPTFEEINEACARVIQARHPGTTPEDVNAVRRSLNVNPEVNWQETRKGGARRNH